MVIQRLKMQLFFVSLLLLILQASALGSCEEKSELKDTISHKHTVEGKNLYSRCWKILNPSRQPITLTVDNLKFQKNKCKYVNITVTVNNKIHSFCDKKNQRDGVIIGNTDALINFNARNIDAGTKLKFQVSYEIGIPGIPQVKEARLRAIEFLKNTRTSTNAWKKNTARAIVALYLSGGATFNGTRLEEEMMVKEAEIRTAVALLKKPIEYEELSMFINSLLVTCHNPRQFYGKNLVEILKEEVTSRNFTHPIAYLSLCNAKEAWPSKAFGDLSDILNSEHKRSFDKDFQAIAVMALSCYRNNNNAFEEIENGTLRLDYERTVKEMKEQQLLDGSFGNIHTTALVAQALISHSIKNAMSWYANAVEYLINKLNSSIVDFNSVTLSLPVLNAKSLVNITNVDCSSSVRRYNDAPDHTVLESEDHLFM